MKKKTRIIVALALALGIVLGLTPLTATAEERAKITVTIYDRGKVPASEGTIEENRWTKWINENGPVDVEFVAIPRTNSGDKLYVLFASGTAPDLVFEYSPSIRSTLYQQGQLMPLTEALEQYSTLYKARAEQYPNILAAGLMDDGELYGLGKINASNFTRGVLIRQDWLDKLGLEIPQTLDELREVCRAFCEDDPDGNGENDTYAMAMSYRANESFNQMIYGETIMEGDGEMRYGWVSAGSKWYYMGNTGAMLTKTVFSDGKAVYAVDENGVMVTNKWIQTTDGTWYHFGSNGKCDSL